MKITLLPPNDMVVHFSFFHLPVLVLDGIEVEEGKGGYPLPCALYEALLL
jgi:hypothetical protein